MLSANLTIARNNMKKIIITFFVSTLLFGCAQTVVQQSNDQIGISPQMSFFVTSVGLGDGGNLGGLSGADAHCETLATSVGQGGKAWRAYLSTTGAHGVDARDRIGDGPWFNARGELIAANLEELHGDNNITGESAVTETGADVPGRDTENGWRPYHDMFTGTQNDGTSLDSDQDTTCNNWTSNNEGSALLGHHNRVGGGYDAPSWVNAHASSACSAESMNSSAGLFYCFASSQ